MSKFRKAVLCGVAGVALSPVAMAADLDGPSWSSFASSELLGTATTTTEIQGGRLAVILGAEFAVTDRINLALTGSAVASSWPSSVISACVPESAAGAGDGLAGVTFGLVTGNADGATYRVTEIDSATCAGATSTNGVEVVFADGFLAGQPPFLQYNARAVLANNGVTATYSAEIADGTPLDTGGGELRSVDVWVVASQFKATVGQPFDNVVDVNTNRTTFATGSDCPPGNCDLALWTVNGFELPAGIDGFAFFASTVDQDLSVTADWSYIFDTSETTAGIQPGPGVLSTSCVGGIESLSATTLTSTCFFGTNSLFINTDANLDPADGTSLATLPATNYTSTHVLNYFGFGGTSGSVTVTNVVLGAWTLNGFQSKVAYMPYQTGIGQIIYIANRSSQAGAITIDWIDQNGNSGSFDAGTVAAGSTRALADAIRAGLPAEQRQGGRLALTITANVPACDAQLNAQYNVSGDRAFSVATDNCPVDTAIH